MDKGTLSQQVLDITIGKIKGGVNMTVELQVGATGKWVEMESKDEIKRFLFPPIDSLEGRIQTFIKKHPTLNLVRIGDATVTSQDVSANVEENVLEGIASKVDGVYQINLHGTHPVLPNGPARYSQELVHIIADCQPEQVATAIPFGQPAVQVTTFDVTAKSDGVPDETPVTQTAVAEAEKPKNDLAAQLRAQMQQQVEAKAQEIKSQPVAEKSELEIVKKEEPITVEQAAVDKALEPLEKKPVTPDVSKLARPSATPTDVNQQKFNEAIKKTKQQTKTRGHASPPQNKIDMILASVRRLESMMTADEEEAMTGEDLSIWFHHHAQEIGEEKTFEMLAKRLKY